MVMVAAALFMTCQILAEQTGESSTLRIVSRVVTKESPAVHGALHAERTGLRMVNVNVGRVSQDNGRTWQSFAPKPDYRAGLPHGYRRDPVTSVLDPNTGRIVTIVNALDTPGLDPKIEEPPIALETYYLRYRVSQDGGRTWLFDEPIVHTGSFTQQHPFEDLWIGRNSLFLGDAGDLPIVTRQGRILVPAQMTLAGPGGKLANPGGGWTYTDVVVLIGTWADGGRLTWKASQRVQGDPKRSTRGMIEPTLAELPDGRIFMVMRGSNGGQLDPKCELPSYRWCSVSGDGGTSWSKPEPWTYDDGKPFFSPSSMSALIRHSSGRCFWVGNVSASNCQGNDPRYPVVMGEVDPMRLKLIRASILLVDTEQPEDKAQGRLDLSHFTLVEDRQSKEFVVVVPRAHGGYKTWEYATVRIAVR
jgi:hypothetical protein